LRDQLSPEFQLTKVNILISCTHARSPLYSASWHGCLDAVNFLLQSEEGVQSVNGATATGATPAYAAALRGHDAILRLLHAEGANLVAQDIDGVTPLHAVVWHRHSECLEYLIAQDEVLTSINARDKGGISVLWSERIRHSLLRWFCPRLRRLLFSSLRAHTLLLLFRVCRVAVQRGDENAIGLLTSNGAAFGEMPPSTARQFVPPDHRPVVAREPRTRESTPAVAECKDEAGAAAGARGAKGDERKEDKGRGLSLVAAAVEGNVDELLRRAAQGENMDVADEFGKTPLRLACEADTPNCVRFLVKRGANKESRDLATGSTPRESTSPRILCARTRIAE